jgi:hypothetical protein
MLLPPTAVEVGILKISFAKPKHVSHPSEQCAKNLPVVASE